MMQCETRGVLTKQLTQLQTERDVLADPQNTALEAIGKKSQEILRRVEQSKSTRIEAIDSEVMRHLGSISRQQVENISSSGAGGLSVLDFISALERRVRDIDDSKEISRRWASLCGEDAGMWRRVPVVDALLGTVDLGVCDGALAQKREQAKRHEEELRTQREARSAAREELRRAERERGPAEHKTAADMQSVQTEGEADTKQLVEHVRRELEDVCGRRGRVPFWEFVVDPASFPRSVENLFYASFLVKDGIAKLSVVATAADGNEKTLFIEMAPTQKAHPRSRQRTQAESPAGETTERTSQAVATIDYETWSTLASSMGDVPAMIKRPNKRRRGDV